MMPIIRREPTPELRIWLNTKGTASTIITAAARGDISLFQKARL